MCLIKLLFLVAAGVAGLSLASRGEFLAAGLAVVAAIAVIVWRPRRRFYR